MRARTLSLRLLSIPVCFLPIPPCLSQGKMGCDGKELS